MRWALARTDAHSSDWLSSLCMNKDLILALGIFIVGGMLNGYAWTTPLMPPFGTICVVAGLVLCVVGFISFILIIRRGVQSRRREESDLRNN
jgi:hypothetical protein